MRFAEIADTDPALEQWLMKLHKGAVAGFNAKTTQAVLGLFPGWRMEPMAFIKPSSELGWNDRGFAALVEVDYQAYAPALKQTITLTAHLHARPDDDCRLHVRSRTKEDADAVHAKVATYVVAQLPDPKKAKPDEYFVMDLTDPHPAAKTADDGENAAERPEWLWSFMLYRKCKGYRITAPTGAQFDVCGPTQVLGFGGTKDFGAFFKWALGNTDLEAAVNAKLGLAKHLKASERPRVPVGGQTIGTCAICRHEQVVRDDRMVLHGYQRPGHGYIVGDCFGVGYKPYELSAEACEAYIPMLVGFKGDQEHRLAKLKTGTVEFSEIKHNYRTNRDDRIVTKPGDAEYARMLKSAIADTQQQIKFIEKDIEEMKRRIATWQPGTLRRHEGMPTG